MTKNKKVVNSVTENIDTKTNIDINENINNLIQEVKPKRGRKSKKEMELIKSQMSEESLVTLNINNNHPVSYSLEEITKTDHDELNVNEEINEEIVDDQSIPSQKNPLKKRGRKPKGGKIVQQLVPLNNQEETKPNIILHLKCSMKDLDHNQFSNDAIESYNFTDYTGEMNYEIIENTQENHSIEIFNYESQENINTAKTYHNALDTETNHENCQINKEMDTRQLFKKLKQLEHNLHLNKINDKKSACFWCTHEFDNPPIYIPKHYIKDSYHVYGCFCSPECATAHLMEENIDSSAKFERYQLLNHIYCKIYDYKKNIKPAPNPHYMLEKYYGNLTIQEYRSLLRSERLFLVVDKPLIRMLPELHEDNDDFIINNKIIPSNTFQIKKKLQKKQTKNTIISEKFGLAQ